MKVTPTGWRVLIRKDPPETESKGGILLPQEVNVKEYAAKTRATVLAIGPKAFEDDPESKEAIKVGDRVIIRMYSSAGIDNDEEYGDALVNDQDILAKVEDE